MYCYFDNEYCSNFMEMIHKIAHNVSIELSVDETFNDISHKQLLTRGIFLIDSVVEDFVDGTLVFTVKAFALGRRRRKHRDSLELS